MSRNVAFAFNIGGRDLDPSKLEDPRETQLLQDIVETVVDKTELVQCPEHGEPPRFLCTGDSVNDLRLEVFGCCEALVSEVEDRLNGAAG